MRHESCPTLFIISPSHRRRIIYDACRPAADAAIRRRRRGVVTSALVGIAARYRLPCIGLLALSSEVALSVLCRARRCAPLCLRMVR